MTDAPLVLDNGALRVSVLPALGAMVASLVDVETGREWLDQPPEGPDRMATLGQTYAGREACGWDECFPTVNPTTYPEPPWLGAPLADHGELWSRPWDAYREGDELVTSIEGAHLPYRFERSLSLAGRSLLARYAVSNGGDSPLLGLWALHPLLRARAGMRVLLPHEVDSLTCTYNSLEPHAATSELSWRQAGGRDLSRLPPAEEGLALKLFTRRLAIGRAALVDPDAGSWIGLEWDTEELPYLGLWLNGGGWPPDGPGRYHVAFEPTVAAADDLQTAARTGEALSVAPGDVVGWSLRLVAGSGSDAAAFVAG